MLTDEMCSSDLTAFITLATKLVLGLGGFFGLAYNTSLADQLETKRKDAVEEGVR